MPYEDNLAHVYQQASANKESQEGNGNGAIENQQ